MDKLLFHQLLPYLNAQYFTGRIRWLIVDKNKKEISCVFCGNFANAVGQVDAFKTRFNLPVCKVHVESYYNKHYQQGWSITLPMTFKMNLKHIPEEINFWQ